jgi:hypothetical protein
MGETRGSLAVAEIRRLQNTRVGEISRGERRSCLIGRDACLPLIGRPNFYLILSLNSIISLQIIFLFLYQNS